MPASDFVSFDLYAETTPNGTWIPVEITYLVDGEQRQRTVQIELDRDESSKVQRSSTAKSGFPEGVALVLGGVVIVIVAGIMINAWRNADGGD